MIEPRTYDPAIAVTFRKTDEEFGGLSNMAPGFPLRVAGVEIRTAEALYQACRFPHRPDVQQIIVAEGSPMTAKMRSKPYRDDSRPDWDIVRVPIMKWCLRVKLAQNMVRFGDLLRTTGARDIVEDSRKDDFWGAMRADDGRLHGRNVLGRLLMQLRDQLLDTPENLTSILPLRIERFELLRQTIGAITPDEPRSWYEVPQTVDDDEQVRVTLTR